jgi:NAD(P)-dependent dehydrogenase (short-subunit alcohol dehydrogenase family)
MTSSLNNQRVLIIGGSSGIGLATAQLAAEHGAQVIIAGRSQQKLSNAVNALKAMNLKPYGISVDITDASSIARLFAEVGQFDHLVMTGPAPGFGSFKDLAVANVKLEFEGKFWGQYLAAQHAAKVLPTHGSITFMSGAYSQRPVLGASSLAAVQGAIEGLVRGLAVDLSPLRVNAVSPGLTDTPLIRAIFGDAGSEKLYADTAQALPARYVAQPEDIAQSYIYLMENKSSTGSVLFPDGGHTLY